MEMKKTKDLLKNMKDHWQLYLIMLIPLIYVIVFKYLPMIGAQIAFRDYTVKGGFFNSTWVGLQHFSSFFNSPNFYKVIKNTLSLSFYSLIVGFPLPIILAIMLNEVGSKRFKKTVQLATYAPYFISMVVLVSIVTQLFAPRIGLVNTMAISLGGQSVNYMGVAKYFRHIYVWSGVWQMTGYSSIIYIAALSSIDPSLYESAKVDGATKLQKIIHIDLPSIMPTAIILLIMSIGQIMNVGFEKVYLMQNPLNLQTSETIATYVYKIGLFGGQYSFSTAVGLFNSGINLLLLVSVNKLAKKFSDSSLW